MLKGITLGMLMLLLAPAAPAMSDGSENDLASPPQPLMNCYAAPLPAAEPPREADPLLQRMLRYAQLDLKHRTSGLASYYSTFFDGRKTANGEIYRNKRYSAAHLTLPLGCWIEVKSRATGRTLRLRVNDRGPFAPKFMLDLSQAAAHYLGVDVAEDRHVDIRVIALPGEEPPPQEAALPEVHATVASVASASASSTSDH